MKTLSPGFARTCSCSNDAACCANASTDIASARHEATATNLPENRLINHLHTVMREVLKKTAMSSKFNSEEGGSHDESRN